VDVCKVLRRSPITLTNYAKLVGINILRIAPYTSKQNRTPERISGIILGIARLIIIKANLPEHL